MPQFVSSIWNKRVMCESSEAIKTDNTYRGAGKRLEIIKLHGRNNWGPCYQYDFFYLDIFRYIPICWCNRRQGICSFKCGLNLCLF